MKTGNGEIRAWETIKMTFSTCREKSGVPSPSRMISTQPNVENSVNYPLHQAGN
jgi:hypothetical protein